MEVCIYHRRSLGLAMEVCINHRCSLGLAMEVCIYHRCSLGLAMVALPIIGAVSRSSGCVHVGFDEPIKVTIC